MQDIIIENLCKSYGEKTVLHNFSCVIPSGTVTGLMAPSGAGKTTLLRILMGFEHADSGSVHGLDGARLSAVFQDDCLCENLTPVDNIRLVSRGISKKEAESALMAVGLNDCLHQPVRELSGGMKRRVAIMRALSADYDLLILDEPFKGLDKATKAHVMQDTRSRCKGRTVIFVTHETAELEAMGVSKLLTLNQP